MTSHIKRHAFIGSWSHMISGLCSPTSHNIFPGALEIFSAYTTLSLLAASSSTSSVATHTFLCVRRTFASCKASMNNYPVPGSQTQRWRSVRSGSAKKGMDGKNTIHLSLPRPSVFPFPSGVVRELVWNIISFEWFCKKTKTFSCTHFVLLSQWQW